MDNKTATTHQVILEDAHDMSSVADQSVHLVVTSPPYPMIEMWDNHFSAANAEIADALSRSDTGHAFELMHRDLDGVWKELQRVLAPGGIACINIGDATRSFQGHFRLFANHARIINTLQSLGLYQLPTILWRKTTNAPNKFMGSGMMPPGAYVTLEHEYILIFRKGPKREFPDDHEKLNRRQSAYFWEERNLWFSDVWMGIIGSMQELKASGNRQRSGAFPLELPHRLINMFSVKGDRVLDPFLGSGTTMLAAMCTGRNSLGYEIDASLLPVLLEKIAALPEVARALIENRIAAHLDFIRERTATKGDLKYSNRHYGFAVMTRQEIDLCLARVRNIRYLSSNRFSVDYVEPSDMPAGDQEAPKEPSSPPEHHARPSKGRQLKLF